MPGTVGRTLLDTGRYVHEDTDVKPKIKVEPMDFSAHCGRDQIIDLIKKLNPEKTILVHGDNILEFQKELKEMGFDALAPSNGDTVKI